jgi:N-acetylglucosamine kinase-like BadF-type ATPase
VKRPALLAIDGGGSKTDAVLMGRDGRVIAARRVASAGYHETGDQAFLDQIATAVTATCDEAGIDPTRTPVAEHGVFCLAGADLPVDDRRILRGLRTRGWVTEPVLRNDTFAVLRAGTDRSWGVGVVCGTGENCTGVGPDGRIFRFPAVGGISGDWGGGWDLGEEALWHAIRAQDGRGEPTSLRRAVPAHFGLRRPSQVMEALYLRRLPPERLPSLAPVVFAEAATGDRVARALVDRQADEIATMASVAIRRLRMAHLDPDVVLGGGIFRNGWEPFFTRIEVGVRATAPLARIVRLSAPPVLGAAMLGLDVLGAGRAAHARARATLTHERLSPDTAPRDMAPRTRRRKET